MPLNLSNPRLRKGVPAGILAAAILYVFFLTDWVPFTYKATAGEIQGLERDYAQMSAELNKARQASQRLPYLEKESRLLNEKWERSRAFVPETLDMAWLLRTVTLLGNQSRVEFTLFRPLPLRPEQFHTANPVEVKVIGGYHEIGEFLAELANLNRIITVHDLEVTTPKDRDSEKAATASFVASTYTLGGTGVAPETAADEGTRKGKAGSAKPGGKASAKAPSEAPAKKGSPPKVRPASGGGHE